MKLSKKQIKSTSRVFYIFLGLTAVCLLHHSSALADLDIDVHDFKFYLHPALTDGMSMETVKQRLDVYHAQTEPLVDYYKKWEASGEAAAPKYIHIPGVGKVEEITGSIFTALDAL